MQYGYSQAHTHTSSEGARAYVCVCVCAYVCVCVQVDVELRVFEWQALDCALSWEGAAAAREAESALRHQQAVAIGAVEWRRALLSEAWRVRQVRVCTCACACTYVWHRVAVDVYGARAHACAVLRRMGAQSAYVGL